MTMTADERAHRVAARDRIQQRRVEKAEIRGEAVAESYLAARGLVDPASIAVVVDCPLPGYTHLKVHYRTNNQASRMRAMPRMEHSPEIERLRVAVYGLPEKSPRRTIAAASLARADPLDPGYLDLWHQVWGMEPAEPGYDDAKAAYEAAIDPVLRDFTHRRNLWLASFVRRIEGWNFARVVGEGQDGEPLYEAIPEPDPADPDTFSVFDDELEDLGDWLPFDGYQAALAKSLGPGFRGGPSGAADKGSGEVEDPER